MSNGVTQPRPMVYLWGERGLVTAFFLDASAGVGFDRWERFLDLVCFQRAGALTSVWCVVEPDFGNKGFGHPDVVARLTFEGGRRSVFLMEAKLTTYQRASWPSDRRARNQFNSKLNGQIELNHRLALALEGQCDGQDAELAEPGWLIGTDYITPNGQPRSLKDEAALRLAAELTGMPAREFHHVIITTDEGHPAASLAEERRPRIIVQESDGTATLPWDLFRPRLIHCNWAGLASLASSWQNSLFQKNYGLFGVRLQATPPPGDVVGRERLAYKGVRLVVPNPALQATLKLAKPTYLHLSWSKGGASFILRDYCHSIRPRPVKFRGSVQDALRSAEHQIPYSLTYRRRETLKINSEKWHHIVLGLNRRRWPEYWPAEDVSSPDSNM